MSQKLNPFRHPLLNPNSKLSTPESKSYVAGVVEFYSEPKAGSTEQTVRNALSAYVNFIAAEDDLDIIVFPESTLNNFNYPFRVPNPSLKVVVCGNLAYDEVMQKIACAARQNRRYVVINVTERSTETGETKHHNTNVVFDRNGAVVSRYRKWNLYGEANMDLTPSPEISYFTTDFNVTFGHFICFDIMFSTPALSLLELGITDIIFPTMWFGQLPFLTGIQTQAMWAYKNEVNFLSAGAGNPERGSTGSGIISGKFGPLKTLMSPVPQRKLLVAKVLKRQYWDEPVEMDDVEPGNVHPYSAEEMAPLFLKRDNLELYNTIPLEPNAEGLAYETVCYEETCCHFEIQARKMERVRALDTRAYKYRLTAFDGVKSNRGTLTCAVIACTDDTLASCGYRFGEGAIIEQEIIFESIVISTTFAGHTFNMPNVLDLTIMPLSYDQVSFYESDVYTSNG